MFYYEGATAHWPALNLWTNSYLRETLKDVNVTVAGISFFLLIILSITFLSILRNNTIIKIESINE